MRGQKRLYRPSGRGAWAEDIRYLGVGPGGNLFRDSHQSLRALSHDRSTTSRTDRSRLARVEDCSIPHLQVDIAALHRLYGSFVWTSTHKHTELLGITLVTF